MKLRRTAQIRQNFFVPSAHSSFTIPVFHLFRYGSTPLSYPYPYRSRLSSLLANRLSRLNPSSFYPPSFLRITRPLHLPSIRSSTSFCCFDILSTTVIVLRSWPSWVCRISNAHGGCDVYPTLASILFCFGCATYPMLVVGVTCTLS